MVEEDLDFRLVETPGDAPAVEGVGVPGAALDGVPHPPLSPAVDNPAAAAADDDDDGEKAGTGSIPFKRSEAITATAEADAYVSRQPRCPQAQGRPFGPGSTIYVERPRAQQQQQAKNTRFGKQCVVRIVGWRGEGEGEGEGGDGDGGAQSLS